MSKPVKAREKEKVYDKNGAASVALNHVEITKRDTSRLKFPGPLFAQRNGNTQ